VAVDYLADLRAGSSFRSNLKWFQQEPLGCTDQQRIACQRITHARVESNHVAPSLGEPHRLRLAFSSYKRPFAVVGKSPATLRIMVTVPNLVINDIEQRVRSVVELLLVKAYCYNIGHPVVEGLVDDNVVRVGSNKGDIMGPVSRDCSENDRRRRPLGERFKSLVAAATLPIDFQDKF